MKSKHDYADLLRKAGELLRAGQVKTYRDLSGALGIKTTTLQAGFLENYGVRTFNDLVEKFVPEAPQQESTEAEFGDNYINIVCASRRIRSVDDALREFKIDTNIWEVDKYKVKSSEGYRKDRKVRWQVIDGITVNGDVEDTGKLLIAPMYHVQVTLRRKSQEIRLRQMLDDFIEDAKKHAPHYAPIKRASNKRGMIYEIDMPDIHFGKETWAEESGQDYNIEIARKQVMDVLGRLLLYGDTFKPERIILPMGNDFFNSDTMQNTTTHGTPQQEDTRWNKTFREGKRLAIQMIDLCLGLAPVDVVMVPGNHDEQRSFYLGEILDAQYFKTKQVTVDNLAKKRKYKHFGKVLIGYTHGYHEKITSLPSLMPLEASNEWANSLHREWHLGDKHHKKDLLHRTEDLSGVTIRLLRSLSANDTWHFDKAFVGAPRTAEGFMWDRYDGLIAQFQAGVKE